MLDGVILFIRHFKKSMMTIFSISADNQQFTYYDYMFFLQQSALYQPKRTFFSLPPVCITPQLPNK